MNIRSVFILLLFFLFASCSDRGVSRTMDEVESVIQDRPDSALQRLRTLDPAQLGTKSQRARYSLLHAMALDKNYIDTTDVSVVMPAVEYYRKHGTADQKMKAWYYLGRIQYNRKEYPQSLVYYTQAMDASEVAQKEDHYLKGLIYGAMADAYNASYNAEEELKYARLSYESYEKLGDGNRIRLPKYKYAQACHNNGLFDRADSLYASVYSGADSTTSLAFYAMTDQIDNDLWRDTPDVQRDIALLEYVAEHGGRLSLKSWYEYAYLLLLAGENDAAETILSQLSGYADDGKGLGARYRIAEHEGRTEEAFTLLKTLLEEQNKVVKEQLAQSVFKAQSDHYRLMAELSEQRTTIADQRSLIVIILALMFLMLACFVFRRRRNALVEEKEQLMQAVEESERLLETVRTGVQEAERNILDLKRDNERERGKIRELRNMYVRLYQKRFQEIGKYYGIASAKDSESISAMAGKEIIASMKALLKDISGDSEGQKKFEERIDGDLDGIISKIRKDFPKLNDEDIRFLCYMIVGFDSSTVSFLMDMTKENVRVKRHRLRARMGKYSGPHEDLYGLFI